MFVASSGKLSITLLAAKNKEKPLPRPAHPLLARSQHLSPPAQYPGGLGVPCPGDSAPLSRKGAPLLLFPSVVSPASSSTKEVLPLRKGSASYLQSACDHLDQVRREEKPIGLHFLRSSFTNNRADAFSPGSASQLVETPQGWGVWPKEQSRSPVRAETVYFYF